MDYLFSVDEHNCGSSDCRVLPASPEYAGPLTNTRSANLSAIAAVTKAVFAQRGITPAQLSPTAVGAYASSTISSFPDAKCTGAITSAVSRGQRNTSTVI